MTQTTMPKVDGGHHGCRRSGGRYTMKTVEFTGAIKVGDLGLGLVILHRQAKGIKFDRNIIVSGESTDRDKILN